MLVKVIDTSLAGVKVIEPKVYCDDRGYFYESYQAARYQKALGLNKPFVQDNVSRSTKNVLRGLHHQIKNAQAKLISVSDGQVFDVAVDIREGSPTFGQWVGEFLSSENKKQIYIPEGFLHGFLVLSDYAEINYKCSDYYAPKDEICVRFDDKTIGIDWPEKKGLILSEKDKLGLSLMEYQKKELTCD